MHLQDYTNLYTSKDEEEIYYVLLVILAQHIVKKMYVKAIKAI